MKTLLDAVLVGAALLASCAYLYKALAPRALKLFMAARLSALAARAPVAYGLRRLLGGLAAASAAKTAGGCGGCDGCAAAPSASTGAAHTGSAEVRVPLSAIGKRR